MRKLLGLVTFAASFVFSQPAESQEQIIIYVNRTDPSCGGESPCYVTIQGAVDAAQPGYIVRIQAGTYPEQVSIEKNKFSNATEFDRIVVEADPALPPGQVVLTGAPGPQCTDKWAIRIKQSKFVTIRGLTITGTGAQAISLMGGNNDNQDIHIELNRIFGNGSASCNGGITIARGNPGTLIVNNLLYANGRNAISFEDAEGGPHYIISNTVYGNQWNGIDVARNHTVTIANNIINKNGTASGSTGGRFGVRRENSNNPQPLGIKLRNNLICGNTLGEINGPVLDATDAGNFTLQGSEGTGVAALPGCSVPSNLFVNLNGPDNLPNTEDDDFSLRVNSFAIDVGIDPRTLGFNPAFNPIFEADFAIEGIRPADGNADRVVSFDAGAFEFPNAPPVANAGVNQVVFGGQLVILNGSQSSDPEGATLAYQWTIVSQPGASAMTLTGATTISPTFTPLVLGQYVFQLVVNDGQLYSTPSTVVVNVINAVPTANSLAVSTDEDTPINITLVGSDIDGNSLTFTVVGGPNHGSLSAGSGMMVCVLNGSCTADLSYTPTANYSGPDSFSFTVSDGQATSASATTSITINSVDDAPTARNIVASTNEDTPLIITLRSSDLDSVTASFTVVSSPSHGTLSLVGLPSCTSVPNGDNTVGSDCTATVTYIPAANYHGDDSFTYKTNDGSQDSNVATVSVSVTAVNDAPVANGQSVATNEDATVTIVLGAIDIDSQSLNFSIVTNPSKGTLGAISGLNCVANGSGSSCTATVIYVPTADQNGADNFSFKVNDGNLDSNVATVSITLYAVNDGPVASDDFYAATKETPLSVAAPGLIGNDNDAESAQGTLTALLVNAPVHAASFTLNADGSFIYAPAPNFTGIDSFTYKANDGTDDSNMATVTIAVVELSDSTIANNDFYKTDVETTLNVPAHGVLANDNDADTPATSLTATLITGPSHAASFTLNADGSFEYTPAPNFIGTDSFSYSANDGSYDSNEAMVTIAVLSLDHVLVAENDTESIAEDGALSVPAPGVLENDTSAASVTATLVSGPRWTLYFTLNSDGSFSYIPGQDFNGVDSFTYRVFDGSRYSNVAMATIDIFPVNDAPVANSQSVATNQNTPKIVTLSAGDIDSANLTFSVVNGSSHGSLGVVGQSSCTIKGQGSSCTANVTYIPAPNYHGPDSFAFGVTDGQTNSNPATVSITVNNINDAPSANAGGPYAGNVGVPIQFVGSGVDSDGDPLVFTWNFGDGAAATGANPLRAYSTPGTYVVTLTVTDPFGATGTAQTTATIAGDLTLNPIGHKAVNLGETLRFTVSATNSSGAPVGLFVSPLPLPSHANFNSATGVFTFTPDMTQVGSYQLTFTAASGNQSVSETITVTVPNPPPGGTTGVSGRIYNLNQSPLGNVKVTLKATGQTSFSGNDGFFTIMGIPSGKQELIVNGRAANLGVFAILAVSVNLIDSVLNNLASPITLPDVDIESEVPVSSNFNTVVTNPNLPGVELTIFAGSARNPDGTPFTGKLSINPVPDYGRPESRPEELRPGMAVTIQPAGIRFDPPARITFPNVDGMPVGNELNLWSLSPDTGTFNIVGKSAVSSDGQSVITIEGGVVASAWHFPLASSPVPTPNQGSNFCGSCRTPVGSDANLEEGSLYITHSIPSYRSLGQSRSLSLTYSSITADPRPIITLDTTLNVRAAVPNTYSIRLVVGGVQQGGEVFTDARSLPEDADSTSRLSVQFDASNLVSGRYPYQATVFSNYLNSSIGGIASGYVIVLNRKSSSLGAGWAITGMQQLHPQSDGTLLLTSGDGTALFFSGGPDIFTSPPRDFSTLIKNPDSTYTRTFKDGTRADFDAQGLQISEVDRNGNTTRYSYDGSGRLISITDPVGLITTLTYVGAKLQRITDPASRQTQFQYDLSGNLVRITNPDGSFLSYAYDDNGHIIQAANERGNATAYAYDFAGRFSQSTRPTGETRGLSSSKVQGLADTANGQGAATNPAPIVLSQNAVVTLSDGKGNPTRFTLDSLGQIISQTDALGQTTATQRDANGNPTRITRPSGAVTTMTYDAKGNLLTSTDPLGATATFSYEPSFNQVKMIRDPKGNATTINYDAQGNPIEIIDALGNRTQMTYDTRGLLTSITAAVGTPFQTTTNFTYDIKGNLVTTTNAKGDVTALAYDNAGNVFRSTDAEQRATEFTYDPMNRLVAVLDAALKVTQYSYDAKGNLTLLRDAKNQTTTFSYDGLDRLNSATNSLGLTESFVYDTNGNLTSTTNRNGQTIAFNYDALNRLISKSRPPTSGETGDHVTTFSYDSVGNLTRISNPATDVLNQYDLANRLQSSVSGPEQAASQTVVQINADTVIGENNRQFEGRTVQVNGRILTIDGAHTFANLVLLNGATLTHSPTTATKVNKLDITVTGTIQVDSTSKIDVSGRGFLGGSAPGNPLGTRGMTVNFQAGSSGASGGGYGGLGGGSSNGIYGDFRDPNDVGSGGGTGSSFSGGNGGGLSRIIVQTLNLDGSILANGGGGGCCDAGGGSGGGVRIDVGTLRGNGQIRADGQEGKGRVNIGGGGGGGGRIAVYYQVISGFDLTKISAFGGTGNGGQPNGAAGTVYLQGPGREAGELVVDNNNLAASPTTLLSVAGGQLTLTNLSVRKGRLSVDDRFNVGGTLAVSTSGELVLKDSVVASTVTISGGSAVLPLSPTNAAVFKLDLTATTLNIDSTSRIDVSGRGFLGGRQPGNPFGTRGMTLGFQAGSAAVSGGGYGGLSGGSSNGVYGDFRNPIDAGSGGGSDASSVAGNGGGSIHIGAQTLNLDGIISADGLGGGTADAGGGSGGAIRIDVGTLAGSGQIRANGQDGKPRVNIGGGGGSGGRVAIYYQIMTGFDLAKISAFGGIGNGGQPNGAAGTVYLQGPGREAGELIIDGNNLAVGSLTTPIPNPASGSIALTHMRVRGQAHVRLDSLLTLTGTLELSSNAEFVSTQRTLAGTVSVTNGSLITHLPTTATSSFKVDMSAGTLTVDATSKIDVSGRGFLGGRQPGNPFVGRGMTFGFQAGSSGDAGGGYGGLGGGSSNPVYGNLADPNEPGSGGGASSGPAGNGGGLVRIAAQTFTLNGSILANGEGGGCCDAGGGSGGGIRIDAGILTGTGQIRTNGQDGKDRANTGGGGGGGGRIAVYFQDMTGFNTSAISAAGGLGKGGQPSGQNGSVQLLQQLAILSPSLTETPAMKAEVDGDSTGGVAVADISRRQVFLPSGQPAISENRYLAMLSSASSESFFPTNPKLQDDLDPIYSYDANGNRTSMIDPTGLTTYSYDALNRLTSMTNNTGQTTTFSYDALGRRTSVTHANGVVTNYTYDVTSQLLGISHQQGASTLNSFNYSYDKVGNRNSKADSNGTANYTYDALNRLIQAINPLPSNPLESFIYDPVGNRTNSNQNGASTFNQANQLLEDANFTYQYDNNGNMIRKTAKLGGVVTTYEYDAENKLVRVDTAGKTVNYKYDGLGRRVEKEIIDAGTTTTRYVYDNEDILLELDGANSIIARYTHGPGIDEPLIMEKNGQSFYYHADGLGSITEITNQSGAIIQRYTYSSFGKIESQLDTNFVQPYTFTAREFDWEVGVYYFRARFYDPATGRFSSEDPNGFASGLNFYGFVGNNPVGRIDPYGLDWLDTLSNFSAGTGDFLSGGFMNWGNFTQRVLGHSAIPISQLLRQELVASIGLSDVVDQCSTAYAAGKHTGLALGIGIVWSAGLNGGANSAFWSGPGAKAEAALRGTTLEQTAIGAVLDSAKELSIPIYDWVWKVASATFAGNASGQVQAVTRQAGRVWSTVELQILRWRGIPIVGIGQ